MRLRPKEDEDDPAASKPKKKIVSESQKRSAEDLGEQQARKTTFANDAINAGKASEEERARMLKKRSAEDEAVNESSSEDEDIDASLMEALEEAEQRTLHMTSTEYCMPLEL